MILRFLTGKALILLLAATATAQDSPERSCANAPERLALPEAPAAAPKNQDYRTARDLGPSYDDAYYGEGHLAVTPGESAQRWEWWLYAVIPLYAGPGGEHVGWMNRGWVVREDETKPLSWTAFIETGYEYYTFLVLEENDGWLRIRVAAPAPDDDGTVWTHACRLDQVDTKLRYQSWPELFTSEDVPTLFFRKAVPHALRAAPSSESERLTWIVEDDEVEILEVRGDWVRVRHHHPGQFFWFCGHGNRDAWAGQTREGWVKWWSSDKGTWLWYPTRGC